MTVVSSVLIVGGNGFVGSHVVDALLAAGHGVRVLSPHPELFRHPVPGVDYRFGRLELGAHLESVIEGCDAIVDAVSSAVPSSADNSPASAVATGIGSSTWLGELSMRAGIGCHIYLSSGGTVYGPSSGGRAHRESDPLAPIGAYGALKAGTELALSALLGPSDTRLVSLRVANAYGERQNPARPQGLVGVALSRLHAGQPLTMFGDTVRDLVHASDVGAAVARALQPDVAGTYNVGSGVGFRMTEVLDLIQQIVGRRLVLDRQPMRPFDVPHSVVDVGRLTAAGWRPEVTLVDGLRRTCAWFEATTR